MRRVLFYCLIVIIILLRPTISWGRAELTIGITQYPSNLHPIIDSMMAKTYVLGMVHRPFTVFDQDWQLVCMLCTELPSLDNGNAWFERLADGKQGIAVRYTIQSDARWGDGTPVTTQDVVFTWRVGNHPMSGVASQELYRRILTIDVVDEKTFVLHMDRVTFDFAAINELQVLPEHLDGKIFAADPARYRNRSAFETDPTHPGLYFGPYRIIEARRGSRIVLEANPYWWGKTPYFKRVTIKTIENTAALEANLRSGELDMIGGELGLTLDQALAFEKRQGEVYNIVYKPGLIYEHVDMNLANPILQSLPVRQALLHGIDRKAISEQLFDGKQPMAHSNINPLDWIYDHSVRQYPYNPELAAKLLDQAGWDRLKKGVRYNQQGERLRMVLMSTAGNRSRELVEQVLQSQWRQLGIDVRIRNEPARVFFAETVAKRKYPALAMYAWISAPESVPRTTLHSQEIPTPANNWAGQNYTGYKSAAMDGIVDAIEVELDRDKRRGLWSRLQQLYAQDLPVLPLYFRSNAYILPRWLKGLRPTGHQYPSSLWIEDWHRQEQGRQKDSP